MYTALFALQSMLHLVIASWLLRIWGARGAVAALVMLVPQLGLVYDNLVIAAGSYIGVGPLLAALSWPRLWIHWAVGAWPIVAAGSIMRLAGFSFARTRLGMAGFCLLTAALIVFDLHRNWSASLQPVCELGLVRNSVSVSPDKFCFPDQRAVPALFPVAAVTTCGVVILCGALLLLRRGFPWMLAGGLLMLASAIPPAMPFKLDNLGEVLITGGMAWAIARFAPAPLASPAAPRSAR